MLNNYKISLNDNIDIDRQTLKGVGHFTIYDADTNELYCYLIVNLEGIKSAYVKYTDDDLIIRRFTLATNYVFGDDKSEFLLFLNNYLRSTYKIKCTGIKINYQNEISDDRKHACECTIL